MNIKKQGHWKQSQDDFWWKCVSQTSWRSMACKFPIVTMKRWLLSHRILAIQHEVCRTVRIHNCVHLMYVHVLYVQNCILSECVRVFVCMYVYTGVIDCLFLKREYSTMVCKNKNDKNKCSTFYKGRRALTVVCSERQFTNAPLVLFCLLLLG